MVSGVPGTTFEYVKPLAAAPSTLIDVIEDGNVAILNVPVESVSAPSTENPTKLVAVVAALLVVKFDPAKFRTIVSVPPLPLMTLDG
jgi:hypothetical protein